MKRLAEATRGKVFFMRPAWRLGIGGLKRLAREPENADIFRMSELVFEVTQEEDGGFCAECLSENIFTQGDTWEEMRQNVQQAVRAYYFDQLKISRRIRLHMVRDELLADA